MATRPSEQEQVCLYFIRRTTRPGYAGTDHEPSDCFEYPKNPFLIQAAEKKNLPNFPTQKNPAIENFKPKKDPSIIPVT